MRNTRKNKRKGKTPGQPQRSIKRRQLLQRFSLSPELAQLTETRRSIELSPTEGMPFSEDGYDAIAYKGNVFVLASKDDSSLCAHRDNVILCTFRDRVPGQGMVNKTVVCCELSQGLDEQISNALQLNRHLQAKEDMGFDLTEEERSAKVSTTVNIGKFQRKMIENVRMFFGRDARFQFAVWDPTLSEYVEWRFGVPSKDYFQ